MVNIANLTTLTFTTCLLAIFSLGLGVLSLYRNPKSKVTQRWFLMSLAVSLWAWAFIFTNIVSTFSQAWTAVKVVYFAASWIPILYFHFVVTFLFKDAVKKKFLVIGYILALIFSILCISTTVVISGTKYLPNMGYYEDVAFPGFILFLINFFFFSGYALFLLFKEYVGNSGFRRRQILWILFPSILGFVGGASNFLSDLTGLYPYGQLVVWLYPVLITYGIFIKE